MSDVESELHVHGRLGHAGAPSVDDGDQRAVQFVHVALGQQPAPTAGLVLHLQEDRGEGGWSWLRKGVRKGLLRRYHVSLRGDAEGERVDASGGENGQVRRQGAAGGQSDFLLEAAAGRQHRGEAAVQSFQLVKHLRVARL